MAWFCAELMIKDAWVEFKMKKTGKEKDYYYARTQVSPAIFALEKERIEALGLDQIFTKKETKDDSAQAH